MTAAELVKFAIEHDLAEFGFWVAATGLCLLVGAVVAVLMARACVVPLRACWAWLRLRTLVAYRRSSFGAARRARDVMGRFDVDAWAQELLVQDRRRRDQGIVDVLDIPIEVSQEIPRDGGEGGSW